MTVCDVGSPHADEAQLATDRQRLADAVTRLKRHSEQPVDSRLIQHRSVSVGIIEAAAAYDAVMVGAAGQSRYPQILFGNIPETIAKHANRTVTLIKHYHPVKELVTRVMAAKDLDD